MKKRFTTLLALICLCAAVGAWAEVVPVELEKGGTKQAPRKVEAGMLYHAAELKGYYVVRPLETGIYTFYLKEIANARGYIANIYNEYGEELWDSGLSGDSADGETKEVELVAGKEYVFRAMTNYSTNYNNWFAICSPSQHISFGPSEIRRAATCDTDGYMAQICEYCGGEGAQVAIPATGHKTSMVTLQKATCTENGLNAETCQTCGAVVANVVIPAAGHQPGEFKRKVSALCTEDGIECRACTVCGVELESRPIPAVGHTASGMTTVQAATCISTGLDQDVCIYCKEVLSSVVTPVTEHQPGVWQTGRETTCTGDGYRYQPCSSCGKTLESETIPAFGHSISEWKIIEARCTENGKKYRECTTCGDELEREEIPATGHLFGEWIETLAPTTKAEGEESRSCLFCGAQEERAVEKLTLLEGILGRKKK